MTALWIFKLQPILVDKSFQFLKSGSGDAKEKSGISPESRHSANPTHSHTNHFGDLDGKSENGTLNSPLLAQLKSGLIFQTLIFTITISYSLACFPQAPTPISEPDPQHPAADTRQPSAQSSSVSASASTLGSISGTVVDQSGAVVVNAEVKFTAQDLYAEHQDENKNRHANQIVRTGDDGEFSFNNVAPGPFQLSVTSVGFSPKTISGVLNAGEVDLVPSIVMTVASNITEVKVGLTREEVAEIADEQLKIEEQQRVFGAIPNFYVSYIPNAAPLTTKQKFKLALRSVIDPFTFVVVAGTAGVEQAQDHFVGYGQGTEGYAKRFGAGYADTVSGTFIGSAIFPSLLKQDPRYFYKGTGRVESRFLYAIANAFVCKGDNKRWQPNYSNVLGSLAAGGISNIYYPPQDRNGMELTFVNAGIGIGETAISNLLQEFLIKKLTPAAKKQQLSQP
jgi:hypothetical protein